MTGFPASDGSSSTSTEAKKASMSTWRMVGTVGAAQPPRVNRRKPSAKAHAGPPALLGRPPSYGLAGPSALLGELRAMALDRGRLGLDGVGDVDPLVGLERSRQQHRRHLVRRTGVGEVERQRGRRRHGVEQRRAGDAVVAMVEVAWPKKTAVGSCPQTTSGRSARTRSTRVRRKPSESASSPSGKPRLSTLRQPISADDASSSPARSAPVRPGSTDGSVVPLPPSVQTTRWTALPALAQRARVPPQATSASSGWA